MPLLCSGLVELNISPPLLCLFAFFVLFFFVLFQCYMPLVQGEGGSLEGNYHLSFCFLPVSTPLPPVSMVSPLKPEVFAAKLSQHPDQHLVAFVLDGLRNGFRLGFDGSTIMLI